MVWHHWYAWAGSLENISAQFLCAAVQILMWSCTAFISHNQYLCNHSGTSSTAVPRTRLTDVFSVLSVPCIVSRPEVTASYVAWVHVMPSHVAILAEKVAVFEDSFSCLLWYPGTVAKQESATCVCVAVQHPGSRHVEPWHCYDIIGWKSRPHIWGCGKRTSQRHVPGIIVLLPK